VKNALLGMLLLATFAAPVCAQEQTSQPTSEAYTDPLAPFNEKMFWFNLKLDDYVLRPVASVYGDILPEPVRRHIDTFWDNINVVPRFANNLFQFKLLDAGGEVSRFAINSTLGLAGFFDVADPWFGLKEHDNDFGLTLHHYGVPMGPYLVLPFMGPSTIRDTVGRIADGSMNPMNYTLPTWWMPTAIQAGVEVEDAVNYRSLNMQLFEDVDRYAIDLYGAVQDGYLQHRHHQEAESATF
jgi:phospholipid-binding lipoprotein MlaA